MADSCRPSSPLKTIATAAERNTLHQARNFRGGFQVNTRHRRQQNLLDHRPSPHTHFFWEDGTVGVKPTGILSLHGTSWPRTFGWTRMHLGWRSTKVISVPVEECS